MSQSRRDCWNFTSIKWSLFYNVIPLRDEERAIDAGYLGLGPIATFFPAGALQLHFVLSTTNIKKDVAVEASSIKYKYMF